MAQKIIIVGAGIIGACAAYQLQKAGAQVTVLDAGGASATQASFGWLNASFFENDDHFQLRAASLRAYRDLSRTLSLPVRWSGALCWEETGPAFDAQRDALVALGYDAVEIDAAAFGALEPHVAQPPSRFLVFAGEAAAEPQALADALLKAATGLGARRVSGVRVTAFKTKGARVAAVRTDAGTFEADSVLVAAGTATQNLMASVDVHVPMLRRPALMLKTRPIAPILSHVLVSPIGEVRQLPCGALQMPAAISHQRDTAAALPDAANVVADAALARLQALIPNTPLDWARAVVAHRPVPQDGLPVAGHVADGLYVATMHSGLTLGALMGELIATELLQGPTNATAEHLARYRPGRFAP